MANGNSRGNLQVGRVVNLETLGELLYESSMGGSSMFVGREGNEVVRYSVPTGTIVKGSEGYVVSNYSREVLGTRSPRFTQIVDELRRAKL